MSEAERTQKDHIEYIVAESDFKVKNPKPLKPKTDRFRKVELIRKIAEKKEDSDDEDDAEVVEDLDDYVRIQLSDYGKTFAQQVDVFVNTDIHPSLVQFEGYEMVPHHAAITKYYPNGSLQHMLDEIRKGRKIDKWDSTMKSICVYGLVSAVAHIHNTHDSTYDDFSIRYLCPENIIFDAQNHPRLIHYVFGKESLGETPNAYIPPELHKDPDGKRYDEDVWAIGMILFEILTGEKPYKGMSEKEVKEAILNKKLPKFPAKSKDTDHIIGIIQNCLEIKPQDRPLPFILFHHLSNTSVDLFPGTNKIVYDNYRNKVSEQTATSDEMNEYAEKAREDDSVVDDPDEVDEDDDHKLVRIGRYYQKGLNGYEKDEKKGFECYKKAAENDYPIGLFNASLCLASGIGCKKDVKKAFKFMEKAAKSDLEKAVSQYGIWVRDGKGTEPDLKKAVSIFKDGADKNFAECQFLLAQLYYDGNPPIVKKDVKKALQLYNNSASNGFADAHSDLAFHYFIQGKENDDDELIQKGINLFKKAARRKCAAACINLGRIYKEGKYVDKDLNAAVDYYKKAADLKDLSGMVEYGLCLKNGTGVKKDLKKAKKLFKDAADRNSASGKYNLALLAYDDDDVENAAELFKEAADDGNAPSMFYYAKIVINGEGDVEQDVDEGKKYLKKYATKVPKKKWIDGTEKLVKATKLKV